MDYRESRLRTLTKGLSWRILAGTASVAMVYFLTGRVDLAASFALLEIVVKFGLYILHERVWDRFAFGRYLFGGGPRKNTGGVIWFTGLSGSGKSTLADGVAEVLGSRGFDVERLDGDVVRSAFPNTGFDKEARTSHLKRIGFLASMLEKHGVLVVASFISPYRESRDAVRSLSNNFVEVYVSTPLEECEKRDVKGLYEKARKGEIRNFTGIDDPYEEPTDPELSIDTRDRSVDECVSEILDSLASATSPLIHP